jgi:hypothetical protein
MAEPSIFNDGQVFFGEVQKLKVIAGATTGTQW